MNNPAQRLHKLLSATQSYRGKGTESLTAWSEILNVKADDYTVTISQMAKIYDLPKEIEALVRSQPDIDHKLYLNWFKPVSQVMRTTSWSEPIKKFADRIDPASLHGLAICADLLSRSSNEKEINENELNTFWGEINETIDRILNSTLDPNLKTYIVDHLDSIRKAIRDFRISGSKPIIEAYEKVVGSLVTNKEIREELINKPESKSFWSTIGHLGMILTISWTALQIGEKAYDLVSNDDKIEIVEEHPIKNITPETVVLDSKKE